MLKAFDNGFVYTSKKHSRKVLDFLEEGDDDAIEALIQEEKVEKFAAQDFTPVFRQHVDADLTVLREIQQAWQGIQRDPKWLEFKQELMIQPIFKAGKLIIFSEFSDTARYLAGRIKAEVESRTLFFSSLSSPEQRQAVIANFDANSREEVDDYRILVTTDVLAEGVNLHRSAVVINYDIPWNPSRMMQRVGRVNRVGTKFKTIFTYNFFPTDEGNDEIALTEAAKSKIHAFITLLGNDARLLTGDEEITSHNLFDRINSRQAAEGDPAEPKSELKYLRLILDIKEQQPALFQRILALPRKARSSRGQKGEEETQNLPAVLTYFRQGRLDKFFRAQGGDEAAEELDFFSAAEILETTAQEPLQEIPAEQFYRLLDQNKRGFQGATTAGVDSLSSATATSGHEAALLKRLRARDFRNAAGLTPEDRKLAAEVHRLIAEGRIGKNTLRKVKAAFEQTADPVEMVAILRKEVASQYLLGAAPKADSKGVSAPRELILSSWLRIKP